VFIQAVVYDLEARQILCMYIELLWTVRLGSETKREVVVVVVAAVRLRV